MRIETVIHQRLQRTGKVHVSGWGTFALKHEDARWNHLTDTAFPAGQYLTFRALPGASNDTLLPEVMKSLGVSLEVAEQWVQRKIQGWQEQLDGGNVIMLSGLGSFTSKDQFQPETGTFDDAQFGFAPVMIHKLSEPSALQSKVVASLKMAAEDRKSTLVNWQRTGAAAAVAALFAIGVYQTPVVTQVAGWLSSPAATEVDTPIEEDVTPSIEDISSSPSTPVEIAQENHGYSIVVGSFKVAENADNYALELQSKDFDAVVIPGSLRKVGIGTYASRKDAVKALQQVKATVNSQAWIFAY